VPFGEGTVTIPADTTVDPDTGIVTSSTPPIGMGGGATQAELTFAQFRANAFDTLFGILGDPVQAQELISGAGQDKSAIQKILDQASQGFFNPSQEVITPSQDLSVPSPFQDQTFQGGGLSFIGGQIFETPIANLSLSQIIDQFNVTASQAANISAIAQDNFGDFDFGTNTGGGIGSIIPSISSLLSSSSSNVSNDQFQGLSAQEIAFQLTGGNISNF